ncbi:MAG: S24 family peptidase [Crocinitomicaceae bacterium]
MEDKITNIKERILQITENKGITKESFFEKIGMSYGNFKGKSKITPINSNAIADILSIYPDVNPTWLLTGNGKMLFNDITASGQLVAEPIVNYGSDKAIPLVNVNAVAGFGNSNFSVEERDVKEYYVIPKFKNKQIDFMIEVEGSSMYPKYNSGDIVACRIINENKFIQWNKTHVIATKDQGIIIKRLKQGSIDENLLMISDNESYDPFEVNKSDISGVALVIGVIRLE